MELLMKSDNIVQDRPPEQQKQQEEMMQQQQQQEEQEQQEVMQQQQLQQEQEEEEEQEQEQEQEQEEKHHHFHVLAVDDSVIDRKLLEKLLKVSSYQVTCVDSGDKALEYLGLLNHSTPASFSSSSCSQSSQKDQGLKVNLIMTDFCMPGETSGYDLLKRVKGSSWKDVPVVVMSSENVPSRINMCLEGGAEEFMLKPLQLSDLHKIQAFLLKSLSHSSCTSIID